MVKEFQLQRWTALCLAGLLMLGTGCSRSAAVLDTEGKSEPTTQSQQEITAEPVEEPTEEQPEEPVETEQEETEETQEPEETQEIEDTESEETERTESSEEVSSRIRESEAQEYGFLVEPLLSTQILEQEFSEEKPLELGEYDWYTLVLELGEDIPAVQGLDGKVHYDAQTVEDFLAAYLNIDVERVRKTRSYSQETGTYVEPQGLGGFSPSARISGAKEENGTLVLVVDLYSEEDKVYNTSVLTIHLEQEDSEEEQSEEKEDEETDSKLKLSGWRYLSNHVIYCAESAGA